jgi:hypothetical protein
MEKKADIPSMKRERPRILWIQSLAVLREARSILYITTYN